VVNEISQETFRRQDGVSDMNANDSKNDWYLPEKSRNDLTTLFKELVHPVNLHMFTLAGTNDVFNLFLKRFTADLARLSDKILVHEHRLGDEEARRHQVTHSPTLLVEPERYHIRFVGAPMGEEGRSFLEALIMVSRRESGLSEASKSVLATLEGDRVVKVFVTPTCPYCPAQVVNAFRCAIERPDKVRAWCVGIDQMQELADRYGVGSVPQTLYNEKLSVLGLEPETRFVSELVLLKDMQEVLAASAHKPGETVRVDCLILGGGPAGLTAGIYAGRAGLNTLILEHESIGGQVALTPVVENYPGYANIPGMALTEIMAAQARQYCEILREEPSNIVAGDSGITLDTSSFKIEARALLIATGATWEKLGVPGETEYFGHGVSFCATCDGYIYKGRKVLVVGGGNTALTDALYLKNLGVHVEVVHRRKQFRAEQYLVNSVKREDIPLHLGCVVEAILGDVKVTGVRIRDTALDESKEIATDGVFVAIGEKANTEVAVRLGCALTPDGNLAVDERMRTNIARVYAAGDVTGGVRQIITAVGQGGAAAIAIFEDLAKGAS
jgi:thioredoxin reductase (NADPH)